MSIPKENPFQKKNPFVQFQRFYSSSSSIKVYRNSSNNSTNDSIKSGKKYYDNESFNKMSNPFTKGNTQKFKKDKKLQGLKKKTLVNPFYRKNLISAKEKDYLQSVETLTENYHFHSRKQSQVYKPQFLEQKKPVFQSPGKNGLPARNSVVSPKQEIEKITSKQNFMSPRFASAKGISSRDAISSQRNSIQSNMSHKSKPFIDDSFPGEVELRSQQFYRALIFPKK